MTCCLFRILLTQPPRSTSKDFFHAMMDDFRGQRRTTSILKSFIIYFVIIDPLDNAPIFLAVTES